jgi:trans-2,3-dihydro-3-hydroxyanthranilate isomerase
MKSYKFIIADVFTEKRFGGNQLAVLTDAAGLDEMTMQDITREMNYSETTFLFPPESGGDFRARIFTPGKELPFAGHPVVGTSFVVVAEGLKRKDGCARTVVLETGVGHIVTEVETSIDPLEGRGTMTQPLPVVKHVFRDNEALAAALSINVEEISSVEAPAEAIDNGITVLIIPVRSLRAVRNIKVDTGALERIAREIEAETVLVFTRETELASSTVHCRVFAPGAGVMEDPATGSANGPLGFYLVRNRMIASPGPANIVSEQGYEMKRPSLLNIHIETNPETREVTRVQVGGGVVISGRGEVYV